MWSDLRGSTTTQVHIALYKKVEDPFGLPHGPLCNRMIENDLSTSTSCVLNLDLQTFSQSSYTLLCTSRSLDSIQLLSLLLAIPVFWQYCVQLHASTLLDNITLGMFDCPVVNVCSFRNCLASVCCYSSHLQTRLASRIICGMPGSLVRDPFVCCLRSFRGFSLVLMLSSHEVFAILVSHFPVSRFNIKDVTGSASLGLSMHTTLRVFFFSFTLDR